MMTSNILGKYAVLGALALADGHGQGSEAVPPLANTGDNNSLVVCPIDGRARHIGPCEIKSFGTDLRRDMLTVQGYPDASVEATIHGRRDMAMVMIQDNVLRPGDRLFVSNANLSIWGGLPEHAFVRFEGETFHLRGDMRCDSHVEMGGRSQNRLWVVRGNVYETASIVSGAGEVAVDGAIDPKAKIDVATGKLHGGLNGEGGSYAPRYEARPCHPLICQASPTTHSRTPAPI